MKKKKKTKERRSGIKMCLSTRERGAGGALFWHSG